MEVNAFESERTNTLGGAGARNPALKMPTKDQATRRLGGKFHSWSTLDVSAKFDRSEFALEISDYYFDGALAFVSADALCSPANTLRDLHAAISSCVNTAADRKPDAANSPLLRSPSSRLSSVRRALEVCSERFTERRNVEHRLGEQLLELAVLLFKRF